MFEELSNRFDTVFKKLKGRGRLSEDNITEAMRDVKRALLEADVNFKVVKSFIKDVKEKALGTEVLKSITPGQQFVKVVHKELTSLMGGNAQKPRFHTNRTNIVTLAGLQGSGKTTACSKLALYFRKKGFKPLLVGCDIHRPAAIDQLEKLGKSLNIPVYADRNSSAQEICKGAIKHAKQKGYSLVIIDTAGRLHIDTGMMQELKDICNISKPDEIYFVADAMTGQDAVNVASEFYNEVHFTGVILTKIDGDARGGAALSIRSVTGVPINFIATGEKPDAFELFHPERMSSRILGMGDIVSFVEKAQEVVDIEKSRKLEKKIRKNTFSLQDFLDQLHQIKKMGSIQDLLAMIPGVGSKLKDTDIDPNRMKMVEAIIRSMTFQERRKPNIIDWSRKRRISAGSGTSVQEVNKLLKQFESMKLMMKRMNKIAGKRGQAAALKNIMPF